MAMQKSTSKTVIKERPKKQDGLTSVLANLKAQCGIPTVMRDKTIHDLQAALKKGSISLKEAITITSQIRRQTEALAEFCSCVNESSGKEFCDFAQALGVMLGRIAKQASSFELFCCGLKETPQPGTIGSIMENAKSISQGIQSLSLMCCSISENRNPELYQFVLSINNLLDYIDGQAEFLAKQIEKAFVVISSNSRK